MVFIHDEWLMSVTAHMSLSKRRPSKRTLVLLIHKLGFLLSWVQVCGLSDVSELLGEVFIEFAVKRSDHVCACEIGYFHFHHPKKWIPESSVVLHQ